MGKIEESKDSNNSEVGLTPTPEEAPGSRDNFGDNELLPSAVTVRVYPLIQAKIFIGILPTGLTLLGNLEITQYAESMGFLPDDEIIADVTHAREITSSDLNSF